VIRMHEYQLIEFSSSKKEIQLVSNQSNLQQVLLEFYKEKFEKMFDEDGCSKGYISVFVNSKQITSVKEIALNPNDEICIVTSISGG
ncbi:TPA: MoaD/ThiS family protein, partial [Legionella pneumophila]